MWAALRYLSYVFWQGYVCYKGGRATVNSSSLAQGRFHMPKIHGWYGRSINMQQYSLIGHQVASNHYLFDDVVTVTGRQINENKIGMKRTIPI